VSIHGDKPCPSKERRHLIGYRSVHVEKKHLQIELRQESLINSYLYHIFENRSEFICTLNIFVNFYELIVNLPVCICESLCAFAIIETDLTPYRRPAW